MKHYLYAGICIAMILGMLLGYLWLVSYRPAENPTPQAPVPVLHDGGFALIL